MTSPNFIKGLGTGILVTALILKIGPTLVNQSQKTSLGFSAPVSSSTVNQEQTVDKIAASILPTELNLGVAFKDSIVNTVNYGAIDKKKFLEIYSERGGLSPEETSWLNKPSDSSIVVNSQNANLILNLLWPLGIANKTAVLSEGPMGTTYKDKVGSFSSTGGWTLGSQPGGQLFNRFPLLALTTAQEEKVREISENIYRPCCGNSTYFPDCNHGAAMLAFVELAVSQGMTDKNIYQKALVLNSYWFPQTYGELAVYFQQVKGIPWKQINPKDLLGAAYSSSQGYKAISQELQTKGLIPKVEGGGGCGV